MEYIVFTTGGKQYKAKVGDVVLVESLGIDAEQPVQLDKILLHVSEGKTQIGNPYVTGVTIKATSLGPVRGKKIRVTKFKAKARYRRTTGHRQHLTQVKINEIISGKAPKTEGSVVSKPKEKKETKKTVK